MEIKKEIVEEALQLSGYMPKTPLGKRLIEIRRKIIVSGQPLLDWGEIEKELADRRG